MSVTRPVQDEQAAALVASLTTEGEATVIALCGEADVGTLSVVSDVLTHAIDDHSGPVVVDLARTAFIDTATLRVLVGAGRLLDDRGLHLTLRSPSTHARRILKLFGLSHLIEVRRGTEAVNS